MVCSNYSPVTLPDRLLRFFGIHHEQAHSPAEVWPLGTAPFIRLTTEGTEGGQAVPVCEPGLFGLLPHFASEVAYGRRTYNARSETVGKLPSFKSTWAAGQRCIIPAEAFFEPCWESGKAVRWRISRPGDAALGIAGLYRGWQGPDGRRLWTFTMLTVNAEGHPVMQRFHKPGDEKRMVVILAPEDHGRWLTCSVQEAPGFFRQWRGPLEAVPAPLPPRSRG